MLDRVLPADPVCVSVCVAVLEGDQVAEAVRLGVPVELTVVPEDPDFDTVGVPVADTVAAAVAVVEVELDTEAVFVAVPVEDTVGDRVATLGVDVPVEDMVLEGVQEPVEVAVEVPVSLNVAVPVGLAPTDNEAVADTVEDRDPVLVRVFDRVPDIVMDDVANPVPVPLILAVND